jgi:hypothetical protein
MKTRILSLTLLVAGVAAAVVPLSAAAQQPATARTASYTVADPARQIEDLGRLFRNGDLAGLAQALVPPSKWEEARLAYELNQLEPISDEDRAAFAEKLQRYTGPGAVDLLMAEIEPELEKARPQAPGALMMAMGAMHVAVTSPESKLTDEQRVALQNALPGVQQWATSTDFLSSDTMRQALSLLTNAARGIGINDIDQLKALPLETALNRARPLLVAAKQAVRLYGIDLDAVADSLQVEVIEINGDIARVRTTVTLFDAPVWAEHELVLVEGRWYGKHGLVHLGDANDDDHSHDEKVEHSGNAEAEHAKG